jgi:hypothetical protein
MKSTIFSRKSRGKKTKKTQMELPSTMMIRMRPTKMKMRTKMEEIMMMIQWMAKKMEIKREL